MVTLDPQLREELGSVLCGNAKEIDDGRGGEGLGVLGEELAPALRAGGADELVELAVHQLPHVVLVLLEATRRQELVQQRPGPLVGRGIHDDHVLEDRKQVPVRLDLVGDVVTLGFEGQRRERPTDRIDRREAVVVLERRHDLLVAGDRDDVVVRLPVDRPLLAEVVPVRVGILADSWIGEEVD